MIPSHIQRNINATYSTPAAEDGPFAYYRNITGMVRGKWYRISEPTSHPFFPPEIPSEDGDLSMPRVIPAPEGWGNATYRDTITGLEGKFSLDITELDSDPAVQFVDAVLSVGKNTGDSVYSSRLHGLHFPPTGQVVLISTTPKK